VKHSAPKREPGRARGPRRPDPRPGAPAAKSAARSSDERPAQGKKPEARRTEQPHPAGKKPEAKRSEAKKPEPKKAPRAPAPAPSGPTRSGAVALIGRANVGKSTLLNAALGHALAITSPTPQTTRDTLLGVLHRENAELRLLDTPGLHKPKSELGRVMNHFAREAARAADVVVFVTDLSHKGRPAGAPLMPHPGDLTLLQSFKEGAAESGAPARPIVLAINKADLARDKRDLLPLIDAFSKVLPFTEIVPLSARREGDADRLMSVVAALCPEGPWQFGADDLTDRPTRYFAAEYVREQILRQTRLEVPHAAAVTIERFIEPESGAVEIDVLIHVERPGQKKILIGKAGETMKRIGTAARLRVKELLGRKVILRTWVRVTPAWRTSAERLAEMGYQKKAQDEGATFLLELPDDDLEAVALSAETDDDATDEPELEAAGDLEGDDDLSDEDQEQ